MWPFAHMNNIFNILSFPENFYCVRRFLVFSRLRFLPVFLVTLFHPIYHSNIYYTDKNNFHSTFYSNPYFIPRPKGSGDIAFGLVSVRRHIIVRSITPMPVEILFFLFHLVRGLVWISRRVAGMTDESRVLLFVVISL